jgi:hypothetical protein
MPAPTSARSRIVPIVRSTAASSSNVLSLAEISAGEVRHATDGWHVLLRIQDVEHRLWLREPHVAGARHAAELSLDNDSEIRAPATRRFRRALNRRPPVPPLMSCPHSVDSDWP